MARIVLGKSGKQSVLLDLAVFMKTRMLITANSGGGKSYLLRLLAELLFPYVQVIIIDPEGEFASLREKFGFVLVGKGGETPADVRCAELVAHRLLELKASSVCDIYELKPPQRHAWVRIFLEALIDAPKHLWRPVVVIVDEAHVFMPEKGQGESEAYGAMVDLATRGRKRGLCPVYATQRLSKLSKNGTAEMLNRLVGPTFEDVDLERSADLLSVPRAEREEFKHEMKILDPGNFYALGRAITKERILFKVGQVKTTHPEPGSANFSAEPPPTPDKVKALLPKLADLPKEAETKAKTEADLRIEIRTLKATLAARPKEIVVQKAPLVQASKPEIRMVEVPVVKPEDLKRIEKALDRAEKLIGRLADVGKPVDEATKTLRATIGALRTYAAAPRPEVAKPKSAIAETKSLPPPERQRSGSTADLDGEISNPQRNILRALREFNSIDMDVVSRLQVAGWLGLKVSGTFLGNLSTLRTQGLIEYRNKDLVLTAAGLRQSPPMQTDPTTDGVFDHVCGAVSNPQAAILKVLRSKHPEWISRHELAETLGLAVSGTFLGNLSTLHTAGMLDYGSGAEKKQVKLADWIFVGQSAAVA